MARLGKVGLGVFGGALAITLVVLNAKEWNRENMGTPKTPQQTPQEVVLDTSSIDTTRLKTLERDTIAIDFSKAAKSSTKALSRSLKF